MEGVRRVVVVILLVIHTLQAQEPTAERRIAQNPNGELADIDPRKPVTNGWSLEIIRTDGERSSANRNGGDRDSGDCHKDVGEIH